MEMASLLRLVASEEASVQPWTLVKSYQFGRGTRTTKTFAYGIDAAYAVRNRIVVTVSIITGITNYFLSQYNSRDHVTKQQEQPKAPPIRLNSAISNSTVTADCSVSARCALVGSCPEVRELVRAFAWKTGKLARKRRRMRPSTPVRANCSYLFGRRQAPVSLKGILKTPAQCQAES